MRDFPEKNTGMGHHFLLQRIFPIQASNPCVQHWQVDPLLRNHQGSPVFPLSSNKTPGRMYLPAKTPGNWILYAFIVLTSLPLGSAAYCPPADYYFLRDIMLESVWNLNHFFCGTGKHGVSSLYTVI